MCCFFFFLIEAMPRRGMWVKSSGSYMGGWVGGWVDWVEEKEAVRMSYCVLGVGLIELLDSAREGGWVGGWVGGWTYLFVRSNNRLSIREEDETVGGKEERTQAPEKGAVDRRLGGWVGGWVGGWWVGG